MAASNKYASEAEARVGLDTCGYAGKWNAAKLYVGARQGVLHPRYWNNVRTHFLGLGGIYTQQKCTA